MGNTISRRNLLRRGAILASALPFAGSLLNKAEAAPAVTGHAAAASPSDTWTERDIALNAPVPLKARLFANENPFGPCDKAKQAIIDTVPMSYQYPFRSMPELTGKIADFEKIKAENILLASGSSPLLMAAAL